MFNKAQPIIISLAITALGIVTLTLVSQGTPSDPDKTLLRIKHNPIRVGYVDNPPFANVITQNSPKDPQGVDVELVQALAGELGTSATFTKGTESLLVHSLYKGELDVMIGGVIKERPWEKYIAFTRPYFKTVLPMGATVNYAWAVPLGENGWIYVVEKFLDSQSDLILKRLTGAAGNEDDPRD